MAITQHSHSNHIAITVTASHTVSAMNEYKEEKKRRRESVCGRHIHWEGNSSALRTIHTSLSLYLHVPLRVVYSLAPEGNRRLGSSGGEAGGDGVDEDHALFSGIRPEDWYSSGDSRASLWRYVRILRKPSQPKPDELESWVCDSVRFKLYGNGPGLRS